MTYRGEDEAQRARIEELERTLATKNAEIAALRGAAPTPGTSVAWSRISGGPTTFARETTLPYAISDAGYEAIARVLRERLRLNATQVGRTLTVPSRFTLERDGDGTRVRLSGDWRGLPGGVIASTLVVGGFSGLFSAGALADILAHGLGAHHGMTLDTIQTAVVLSVATIATVGAGLLTRRRTSRRSVQEAADYAGTFEAILALAAEHAQRDDMPRTRVAEAENESGATAEAITPESTRKEGRIRF